MKALVIIVILFFGSIIGKAQTMSVENRIKIEQLENGIKPFANQMVFDEEWIDRFKADSLFIRGFVQALKLTYSFHYPFDSIKTISKIYAPDSTFKIFTWEVMKDFSYYRQRGTIQMNTPDGSLKLFPLFDFSEFTNAPNDSIRDTKHWIGAIYYKIILKTIDHKKYYTLLGSDDNNERTTKKWIEILTFDDHGQPQFGAPKFAYPTNDETKPQGSVYRFCLEYKKDGGLRMNYDPKYDAIIFDRLTSENEDLSNKVDLVPAGDYEGFKWVNGTWQFIKNPFANTIFNDKQSSLSDPLFDEKGNKNEKKLIEQSKKNLEKANSNDPNKVNDKNKAYQPGENSNN